jgi:hypothetical protein
VRGAAGTYQATMALKIKVEFGRMRDIAVNDSSSEAVSTFIGRSIALREKSKAVY